MGLEGNDGEGETIEAQEAQALAAGGDAGGAPGVSGGGDAAGSAAGGAGSDGTSGAANGTAGVNVDAASNADNIGFEAAIAERDAKIAALEAQIAEASRTADAAEKLSAQIDELKAQAAVERDEHALAAAGCRSVRAGRAMLSDHGGDVAALKAAEPWLFGPKHARQEGATGLPSAGAAVSEDATLKRWRQIAGLDD